jgi:hypothetical protein
VGSDGRVPRRPVHRHGDIADCATVLGETDGMHNSYHNSYNATRCFIAPALQATLRAWRMLAKASQHNAIAPINLIRANWRDRDQLGSPERPIIAGNAASVVVQTVANVVRPSFPPNQASWLAALARTTNIARPVAPIVLSLAHRRAAATVAPTLAPSGTPAQIE